MRRPLKPRRPLVVAPVLVSDESAPVAVGLSPRRFRELVAKYEVPCIRDGHRVLVRAADLEALVDRLAAELTPAGSATDDEDDGPRSIDDVLRVVGRRRAS